MQQKSEVKIYQVGNGNYISGTTSKNDERITFCIDAGSLSKLINASVNLSNLSVDVFFLTHWHYDHYSFFTLPDTSFRELIHFCPAKVSASQSAFDKLNLLYAKKALKMISAYNLADQTNCFGNCPDLGNFLHYSINEYGSSKDLNDLSVTYYFTIGENESANVRIFSGHKSESFVVPNKGGLRFFPLFVFPGDAKESNIGYLSKYCSTFLAEVPLYAVSHHGSPYSHEKSFHRGIPFGSSTRYFISGARYYRSPNIPPYQPTSIYAGRSYYFTSELSDFDTITVFID